MCSHTDGIHRLLVVSRRFARTPGNPGPLDLSHLPAHVVFPTDALARRDGIASLRALQFEKYGLGQFRRAWAGRVEA